MCKVTCRFVRRRPESGFCINTKQTADLVTETTHVYKPLALRQECFQQPFQPFIGNDLSPMCYTTGWVTVNNKKSVTNY